MTLLLLNENGQRVGESHQRAELTDRDIDLMRQLRAKGWSYSQLAETFECSKSQAHRICIYQQRAQTVFIVKEVK